MPSPTASGRYGDVNGTSSWPSEIGTTRSSSSEPPCSTMKTPVRIARNRCTSSTANLGQLSVDAARQHTPSSTDEESSTYATIPAERAKYQTPGLTLRLARERGPTRRR